MYLKFKFLHKYVKYQTILLSLLLSSLLLLLTFIIIIINIIIITLMYIYILYIYRVFLNFSMYGTATHSTRLSGTSRVVMVSSISCASRIAYFKRLRHIYTYIWVNYNISLTWIKAFHLKKEAITLPWGPSDDWIKAIWGWFPLLTMISSEVAVKSL